MRRYTQAPQCLLPTIYKWQCWFQVWTTLCAAGGRGKTPKWTNILQTDAELTSCSISSPSQLCLGIADGIWHRPASFCSNCTQYPLEGQGSFLQIQCRIITKYNKRNQCTIILISNHKWSVVGACKSIKSFIHFNKAHQYKIMQLARSKNFLWIICAVLTF